MASGLCVATGAHRWGTGMGGRVGVALHARSAKVRTRELVGRPGVVVEGGRLPAVGRVAAGTAIAKVALVVGWALMTGTQNKSAVLNTATATKEQLAQRLAAIEDVLWRHGLIGI